MKTLAHLTLSTGHFRNSPRYEVGEETVRLLRPYVVAGGGEIGETGWTVGMIEGPASSSCGFTLHHGGAWLFSCYMAWTLEGDAPMWRMVQQIAAPLGQDKAQKPSTLPWLAVLMMPEAFRAAPSVAMEAGDLERCVAWTVLETLAEEPVH